MTFFWLNECVLTYCRTIGHSVNIKSLINADSCFSIVFLKLSFSFFSEITFFDVVIFVSFYIRQRAMMNALT